MPTHLQARVGRHAQTGKQCQNWADDQMAVINLLNVVPTEQGGAGGALAVDRVVAGISSDALYNAILRFQKQNFPAQQSGFIEPLGPVLARMDALAAAPTAPAAPTGQWGEFKSGSVQRALYKALQSDPQLTHAAAVDVLYATLDNGTVSTSELDDLETVAEKSRSILPRSKAMLQLFVDKARDAIKDRGPFRLITVSHIYSAEMACDFLKKSGRGQWVTVDRDAIGVGLLLRLAYPGLLRQGDANLCGPAAYLFTLLRDRPGMYVRFATELYDRGAASLGGLSIEPSSDVRKNTPDAYKIDPVDWLTMASLRNSSDFFLKFDSTDGTLSGATTTTDIVWWLTKAGYSDIQQDTNLLRHQRDTSSMDKASELYSKGYRVILQIDSNMIEEGKQDTSGSAFVKDRHWIVLQSQIDRSGGNVKMTVFSWGNAKHEVPEKGTALSLDHFLENYFGYVAAKP